MIYQQYKTGCRHCGWKGMVGFGDVRIGPLIDKRGRPYLLELVCPKCGEQTDNPLEKGQEPASNAALLWAALVHNIKTRLRL